LVVATLGGRVGGVMQLTFIPYLTHQGSWRALIEGVRVDASARARGGGQRMFTWALERARERGRRIVQLTTHTSRPDAPRLCPRLGFVAPHEGMKLLLEP